MTEHYSENAKEFISQQAPWRQGVAWWVVLIQGLLLLGLGLYILFRQGADNFRWAYRLAGSALAKPGQDFSLDRFPIGRHCFTPESPGGPAFGAFR